jgi:hypothetical protein
VGLSLLWEFSLEDWLLPKFVSHHDVESREDRIEFVWTVAAFCLLALIGPTIIGAKIIRRDHALRQTIVSLSRQDYLTGLFNRRRITELLISEIQRATRYGTTFSIDSGIRLATRC